MSDVAEGLRREGRERLARMTPEERVAEALALGQAAVVAYAAAHRLERAAQAGRRSSRVMREIIG